MTDKRLHRKVLNNMNCPNCKHELKKIAVNGIELHQCLNCSGLWFNGGELRKTKDREDEFLQWLDVDLFSDSKQFVGSYSTMVCPVDKEPLYEIMYDNANIKVDVCKDCKGVWLDKDEYENIIASLKRTMFREGAAQYLKHLEEQIQEVFTGSDDVISELKDVYIVFRLLENRLVAQWPRIEEILISLRLALLK